MAVKIVRRNPRISEAQLVEFERQRGLSLPKAYKNFLLECNGGEPDANIFDIPNHNESGVNEFFGILGPGISGDLATANESMSGRFPPNCLPVAHAEGGNYLCIETSGASVGRVLFWDHEEEADDGTELHHNLYQVAANFDAFIECVRAFDVNSIELQDGQVIDAWIDPDFLESLEDE